MSESMEECNGMMDRLVGQMAVLSFGLTCFGIGYFIGKDSNKRQK